MTLILLLIFFIIVSTFKIIAPIFDRPPKPENKWLVAQCKDLDKDHYVMLVINSYLQQAQFIVINSRDGSINMREQTPYCPEYNSVRSSGHAEVNIETGKPIIKAGWQ